MVRRSLALRLILMCRLPLVDVSLPLIYSAQNREKEIV